MAELTKRDIATLEWMTLRECATQARVDVEAVRQWCLAYERGEPNGLPSSHFGRELDPAKATRKSRRVHVDDWRKFIGRRRSAEVREAKEIVRQFDAVPRDFPIRTSRRAVASGRDR